MVIFQFANCKRLPEGNYSQWGKSMTDLSLADFTESFKKQKKAMGIRRKSSCLMGKPSGKHTKKLWKITIFDR